MTSEARDDLGIEVEYLHGNQQASYQTEWRVDLLADCVWRLGPSWCFNNENNFAKGTKVLGYSKPLMALNVPS